MDYARIAMTAEDAQWIESRKFSRTDIAMFFGVPPHMIGDTEKSTSWGTGIEQQSIGFVAYTLEDHLTMWEEAIDRDLIGTDDLLYARFNRAALVKGDIKARWEAYVKGLQWGVWSPNEIRALEDQNPRDGGVVYYPPPNMTALAGDADGFLGFGFYPRSGFMHVDLGPARQWGERFPIRATAFASETPPAREVLAESRTIKGGGAAGVATLGAAGVEVAQRVLAETQSAILPLVPYLDTLRWVFIAVALGGIAVTIYARLDDWKRGRR